MIRSPKSRLLRHCLVFGFFLVAILGISPPAHCQTPSSAQPSNEFGLWAGYAPDSARVIAVTSHRQIALLGFRYGRTLLDRRLFSVEYTFDVLPVEIALQPKILATIVTGTPPHTHYTYITGPLEAVYGGGVNPFGLKFNLLRRRRFQPFAASTAGFVASVRPIPIDVTRETKFNFTFDFQLGFQRFNASRTRAWMFGYKLQHISNANRGDINPGVDLNVFFVGYSFLK
jgi:hypothetical protein